MNNQKDFRNYLTKHHRINSLVVDDYYNYQNNTHHIIDDNINGVIVDVYSKLVESRIIFLSTEMETFVI